MAPARSGRRLSDVTNFNNLVLDHATLDLRNPQHCPSTWAYLLQLCELELEQMARSLLNLQPDEA